MKREHHLAHFLNGDLSESELAQMKQSGELDIYQKIALYTEDLETPLSERPEMLDAVLSAPKKQTRVIPIRQTMVWLSAAACIAVLLGVGYWMTIARTTQFRTGYAQFQNITLPDGSRVTLNSDASLNYKKFDWNDNRKLNLEGEAWFKVAKGKRFSVVTPTGTVSVLGTQFNVKSREGKMEVSCFEGKVALEFHGKRAILTKGNSVVIENGQWTEASTASAEPEWMHRQIAFKFASIHEITSELQRVYNIRIDSKLRTSRTFTGVMPADDLDTALRILETAFDVKRWETAKGRYTLKRH
ncbi:FecR family protein [Flavobacterium selenitireducens]|uniref:FecR family protein n=1 Tax=Flavobacterium selenitireducens TaxID=2722704 RepID=UPI00168AAECA|nr:FecR domain-containing protein [Flavobacterium selenitireducens]MBD3583291.1 iron dicitrate transport regulator FecR [Flavobacterium selenitireducens]